MKDKFLVVIGRQYGSGGKSIGRLVAERLGVDYYDKELLKEASERYGFSPRIFEEADERRPSAVRSLLHLVLGAQDAPISTETLSGEGIYAAQSKVIKSICAESSCVIVGRTADYVMRHHPTLLSVFIHAPIESRRRRIVERENNMSEEEAEAKALRNDSRRESYYNYFTGRKWGSASNYHLSLDSSCLTDEECADIIVDILRRRLKKN